MITILQTIWSLWLLACMVTWLMAEYHMVAPPNPVKSRIKRRWFVAGFDKWMGLYQVDGTERQGYWDKKAYWLPIPCIGIKLEREEEQS